jgi:hypothetical protein
VPDLNFQLRMISLCCVVVWGHVILPLFNSQNERGRVAHNYIILLLKSKFQENQFLLCFLFSISPAEFKLTFLKMRPLLHAMFIVASSLAFIGALPSVTIPAGTLKGKSCPNGASAFLSVPFAVPPVGDLRWTAPQVYNETFPAGGYDATKSGPLCIQFGGKEFVESDAQPLEDWYFSLSLAICYKTDK